MILWPPHLGGPDLWPPDLGSARLAAARSCSACSCGRLILWPPVHVAQSYLEAASSCGCRVFRPPDLKAGIEVVGRGSCSLSIFVAVVGPRILYVVKLVFLVRRRSCGSSGCFCRPTIFLLSGSFFFLLLMAVLHVECSILHEIE